MSLTKVTYSMIAGALVNVLDYGADSTGATSSSAAIQAAINTGESVVFPEGTYLAGNLTQSTAGQRFYGSGNVVVRKNADGVLLTASGRGIMFEGIKFDGDVAFTGDCVKTTGDNCVFTNCSILSKNGFALLAEGNGTRITGTSDIYYSDDAAGYAICLGNTSADTSYNQIVGITTSTSVGGILLRRTSGSVTASQVGAINMNTGAMYVANCRINGSLNIPKGFAQVDNCTITGNVTIGDGVTPISNVGFGPNVFMQAGTTFTLNALVRESSIHTAQLTGVTIVDNLTGTAGDINNFIFTKPISYTPTWTTSGSAPVLGNGSLTGYYIRNGRTVAVTAELALGSTSTTGTGDWRFALPTTSQRNWLGSATLVNVGVQSYLGTAIALENQSYVVITADAAGGNVEATIPFTWGVNDTVRFSVQYESV
jgi:hypothetical protein